MIILCVSWFNFCRISKRQILTPMLSIILITTFISIVILCIGFFEIRIPFVSVQIKSSHKKITKHTRKLLRKRLWYNQTHKGFVELPT